MTTEEKIREAYERITTESGFKQTVGGFILFKAGYLALLNSLEYVWAETAVVMQKNFTAYQKELPVKAEREKIIELARELGLSWAEGISGMDEFLEAFYHKAQRKAFEQAAKLIETPNTLVTKYSIAEAIRQLIKE